MGCASSPGQWMNKTAPFDNNGNNLTKVVGSNTTSYVWDFENRLTSVTLPGSGGTVTFAYDPFGRCIKKVTSTTTGIFAYDGDNLIEETNVAGTAVARCEPTQSIDEPLATLQNGATSYSHADGLGSIASLSNAVGSLTNSFRYTGRKFDSETGLYYYRARYYDSAIGRFVTEDGIGNDEGINLYVYVRNSPTNFQDPTGFYKLVGFPPGKIGDMNNAIQSAINKLKADCPSCAGSDGPKIADALQNATFVYKRSLWSPDGQTEECANARPINSKIIHVSSKAFGSKCCRLDSTLAHEATHKVTKSPDEGPPSDMENKCFGCH
jgi:RHS repeat-associated protein